MTLFLLQNTKGSILKNVHNACFNTMEVDGDNGYSCPRNQKFKFCLYLLTLMSFEAFDFWLPCVTFILLLWKTDIFKVTTFIKTENQTFCRVSKWWLNFCLDQSFRELSKSVSAVALRASRVRILTRGPFPILPALSSTSLPISSDLSYHNKGKHAKN